MIFKYRIQQNLFHINFISGWKRETVVETESQGTVLMGWEICETILLVSIFLPKNTIYYTEY